MWIVPWNPVLKLFLLKKVLTGPVNSARDPLVKCQMQKCQTPDAIQTQPESNLTLLIGGDIIIYGIDKITHTNKFYFSHENDYNTKKPRQYLKTSKIAKIPFEPPKWLKCTTNLQNIPKILKWLKCPQILQNDHMLTPRFATKI